MAKLVQTIIPLLLSCVALLMKEVVSENETTSFIYYSFPSEPNNLVYRGDAHVPSGESFLRLTKAGDLVTPQPWSAGYVLYAKPLLFWTPATKLKFRANITFSIQKTEFDSDAADGITFFITGDLNQTIGGGGGNFGLFDSSTGTAPGVFAVEFDTYRNPWDPGPPHIGIDIESRRSVAATKFEMPVDGEAMTVAVIYDETNEDQPSSIAVFTTLPSGEHTFITYNYELKSLLPQQVYIGISSSTGAKAAAVHDIHTWYFSSTLVGPGVDHPSFTQQIV